VQLSLRSDVLGARRTDIASAIARGELRVEQIVKPGPRSAGATGEDERREACFLRGQKVTLQNIGIHMRRNAFERQTSVI